MALAFGTVTASLTGLSQAAADDLPAFTCTDRAGGSNGVTGTVTRIQVAHHDGYDRLVIGFATSLGVPSYELHRQATSTFFRDASGQPVTLDGSAGIRVVLRGSDIAEGVPSDLRPQLPEVRELANIGNFERVVSYGVGLTDQACVRAFELSGPSRLVIDVQTAPDATSANVEAPSSLAVTGHPASANQPGSMPIAAILVLLAVAAGLSVAGLRRFRKQ
ncbi:MAG TPA: hypothetical protein VM674_01640 [Candidatus Acidoferrum sp.]|nr:hypothetical protein [Candidatus Acidoferrum sp.]